MRFSDYCRNRISFAASPLTGLAHSRNSFFPHKSQTANSHKGATSCPEKGFIYTANLNTLLRNAEWNWKMLCAIEKQARMQEQIRI